LVSGALSPFGGGVERRADRLEDRRTNALERSVRGDIARVNATARVQAEKAHAVGYVGSQGMQAVALVSQQESQLAQLVPLATGRLQAIADMTALGIAEVVATTVRRLA
ncbi:unnamed protein product, partial [Phaeothamnion confervicola]